MALIQQQQQNLHSHNNCLWGDKCDSSPSCATCNDFSPIDTTNYIDEYTVDKYIKIRAIMFRKAFFKYIEDRNS